jgi:hypothetical protein
MHSPTLTAPIHTAVSRTARYRARRNNKWHSAVIAIVLLTCQLCGPRYWLSSTAGVHKHICAECYAEKLFPDDVSTASFKLIVDPIVAEARLLLTIGCKSIQ